MVEARLLQELIENEIRLQSGRWELTSPVNLYRPVSYSLNEGGKRLRPLLVLMAYQLFGDNPREALKAALAIEVFHNFTLLHDDIMDKADIRRNRPSVHVQFGENSAILSGDVMAFIAYHFLLESHTDRMVEIMQLFTRTAREICEGQQLDMDFESRNDVTTKEYLEMIRLKTAVLLACSLRTGGMLGGCDDAAARILYEAGIHLGLAFQLQDDLLDTFGDESAFGKKIGGDIVSNKKTFLLTEALQKGNARQKKELLSWLGKESFNRDDKIKAIKNIFEDLKIKELTEEKISLYNICGIGILDSLPVERERKEPLAGLFRNLISRKV